MKRRLLLGLVASVIVLGIGNFAIPTSADTEAASQTTLQRVLDLTLKNSFKMALAYQQFEAAARAWKSAKRRRLPRVGIQGWFSGDLLEIEEWGSNNLGSYLTLDWDFYQDGAIMQLVAQTRANLESALLTRRQTILDLVYNATDLFYDALKARRQLQVAEQTLAMDEMQLRSVQLEYEQRRKSPSELEEAQARLFESRLSLTQREQELEKAILNLQQLTRDDSIKSVADLPREIVWTLDVSLEHCIKTALDRQPNVLIAKCNHQMAVLGVKYAKLKRWPSVRFLTGTDYAFAPLARPDEFGFRVGVILSYPLYDAGDRRFRIEDAKSAATLAQIQLWQAQDQMKQEVTDSYAAVSNQLVLLDIAKKRHEEVKRNLTVAQQRFKENIIDQLEMARTRLRHIQSVQRVDTLRLDALLGRARLLKSVGVSSMDDIRAYRDAATQEKK